MSDAWEWGGGRRRPERAIPEGVELKSPAEIAKMVHNAAGWIHTFCARIGMYVDWWAEYGGGPEEVAHFQPILEGLPKTAEKMCALADGITGNGTTQQPGQEPPTEQSKEPT